MCKSKQFAIDNSICGFGDAACHCIDTPGRGGVYPPSFVIRASLSPLHPGLHASRSQIPEEQGKREQRAKQKKKKKHYHKRDKKRSGAQSCQVKLSRKKCRSPAVPLCLSLYLSLCLSLCRLFRRQSSASGVSKESKKQVCAVQPAHGWTPPCIAGYLVRGNASHLPPLLYQQSLQSSQSTQRSTMNNYPTL